MITKCKNCDHYRYAYCEANKGYCGDIVECPLYSSKKLAYDNFYPHLKFLGIDDDNCPTWEAQEK